LSDWFVTVHRLRVGKETEQESRTKSNGTKAVPQELRTTPKSVQTADVFAITRYFL
jgi:hypothetical protein